MFMFSMMIFILMIGLLMFMLGIFFKMNELSFLIFYIFYDLNIYMFEYMMLFDWISFLFLSIVMLISSMVILYSIEYISFEKNRYFYLLIWFILSMCLMILSTYNMFGLFIGWDLLGLSSYCLVIFYMNYLSYKSGMITLLINRFGDIMLMLMIGLLYYLNMMNMINYNLNLMLYLFLLIAAMTKSAQLPFSSWLPAAMAAPTPISSLVHSSTLVTAGIYLLIRFNLIMELNYILMFISMMTMFIAGIAANLEYDFKKIIALSTLSQLGLMFSILSLGFSLLSFFHLLTHAMFKSMLFMCAGILIHSMGDIQDIRFYGNLNKIVPFVCLCFNFASLSLSGLPFLSGFYSKDKILEFFFMSNLNFFLMIILVMSTILTISYSIRLFIYMYMNKNMMMCLNSVGENLLMNMSMLILMFLTMMGGSMLNYIFIMPFQLVILYMYMKMLILLFFIVGMFMGMYMYMNIVLNFFKMFFYTLMGMNLLWSYLSIYPMKISIYLLMNIEKGLLENFIGQFGKLNLFFFYMKNIFFSWMSMMMFLKMLFIIMIILLIFN